MIRGYSQVKNDRDSLIYPLVYFLSRFQFCIEGGFSSLYIIQPNFPIE